MNYIEQRKNVWLYSATFNNMWWCFNEDNCKQLDLIYNDYKKRNMKKNFDNIENVKTINNDLKNDGEIKNPTFNQVIFDDTIEDEKNGESELTINDDKLNYTVKADTNKFYIDFNNWEQINCDNNRKRKIKLLEFPKEMKKEDYIMFMEENKIKGIKGKLFDDL